MATKLHGILVALVTPMKANAEIDFRTCAKHVEAMIAAGVHGLIARRRPCAGFGWSERRFHPRRRVLQP